VVEIDAASHGGVDDARSLRERAAYAPARDRYKIFIIDEAHMVSTQGFNALLKIVEEPPPHVRFVFATTEPDKVIGTIRSRTHHYPFRLVPPERLQAYLAELCEVEGVPVGHGVLPLVVRAGGGSVRDSLSVLDQLIAGTGPVGLDYALAVSLLGYTDVTLLDDVVDGLAAGDGAAVFGVVDRVISSGHDPRRFVEDLLERLRDLLVVAAVPDGAHSVLRAVPPDQLERMRGQAGRFGRSELSRAADVVNTALTEMTGATSPRVQLELLCARLLLPAADDAERGLRARLDRVEKRLGVTLAASSGAAPGPTRPAPEPAPAPTPAVPASEAKPTPPSSEAKPTGQLTTEQVRRMWPDVLAALSHLKRATWSLISQHAQVLDYDGTRLLLGFSSPGLAAAFGRGAHQEFLRQALIEAVGLDCPVEPVAGDGPSSGGGRAPEDAPAPARAAPPARPAPSRSPSPPPPPPDGDRGRRPGSLPEDDVPPPMDEPPRDDEPPPPEDLAVRRRAQARPPADPSAVPPSSGPAPPPEVSVSAAMDVDISVDDPDIEGSSLVGRPVVEQLLGGRVIEERDE
jgi:DNA polymerase-3 subunit gamma/tau